MIDRFLEYIRSQRRYSPRTVQLYSDALEELCGYVHNGLQSKDLSDSQIVEALQSQLIRGFVANGLENGKSPRTMNLKLSAISSFCNYLVRSGELDSNPVKKVYRPKEDRPLPEFYTQASMDGFFDGLQEENPDGKETFAQCRTRMMILVLYTTGMRRAELCGLKIGDFDRSRKVFRVVGKGDKTREIPVPDRICEEIVLYLKRLNEEFVENPQEKFFLTDKGAPLYPAFVNNTVGKALKGVEGFTGRKSPHVLRHTLATLLLNNGADIDSIKQLLGHSSLAATQVYTHNSFEELKNTYLTAHPRAKKRR